MSQYKRPGSGSGTVIGDVIDIIAPGTNVDIQEVIYLPGSGPTSGTGMETNQQPVSYVHNQGTSSNTWTINHNLNFYPNVTIQDSGGTIVEGEIAYTTRNTLIATFSAAFSGKAYLS